MNIHSSIDAIQKIPGAYVDRNYGQDERTAFSQSQLSQLTQIVAPHQLPEDYLLFLQHYGGLAIGRIAADSQFLDIFGVGPAIDLWYSDIVELNTNNPNTRINQLYIASLLLPSPGWNPNMGGNPFDQALNDSRQTSSIRFYIDLEGIVQKDSILSDMESESSKNRNWTKLADSFSDWLTQIATKQASFRGLVYS